MINLKIAVKVGLILSSISLAAAAQASAAQVYGFCTVRDISFDGVGYAGTVYRTEIFSASRSYDAVISRSPMVGGKESATLERWVGRKYGFRADRTGDPSESQHYCVETSADADGERTLRAIHQTWQQSSFPNVELVRVPWIPMESTALQDRQPIITYQRDLASAQAELAASAARARVAQSKFEQEQAAHRAEVRRVAAAAERQRQTYREEYKKVTGRYPDD